MKNPLLYRIGIQCECFSVYLFIIWVVYGLWHAFLILFLTFYVLVHEEAVQSNGMDIGFWIAGMSVYGVCEFIANGVLFMKFNIH